MAARRGPIPKSDSERRKHQVNCRLTDLELQAVDARRGGLSRGAWLRTAAMQRPPRIIPEINREAWSHLAKVAGGLTYLVEVAKAGGTPSMDGGMLSELRQAVSYVRRQLIGVSGDES